MPSQDEQGDGAYVARVTLLLNATAPDDPRTSVALLPLVYERLRALAARKIRQERAGQTLQATALVHEAYLRLVDIARLQCWDSRWQFFAPPPNR